MDTHQAFSEHDCINPDYCLECPVYPGDMLKNLYPLQKCFYYYHSSSCHRTSRLLIDGYAYCIPCSIFWIRFLKKYQPRRVVDVEVVTHLRDIFRWDKIVHWIKHGIGSEQ